MQGKQTVIIAGYEFVVSTRRYILERHLRIAGFGDWWLYRCLPGGYPSHYGKYWAIRTWGHKPIMLGKGLRDAIRFVIEQLDYHEWAISVYGPDYQERA